MRKAFSLLEITIVLVILSFLIATVVVGTAFREGAAIRTVLKDVERYNMAISNFVEAYSGAPGDYNGAYAIWPSKCADAADCNGDNDQIIEIYKESHLVWKHLALAGLIIGDYTGNGDGDANTQTIGINVPKSSYPKAQYSILHYHEPEFPDEHIVLLGGKVQGDIGRGVVIDANTAFEIDSKIDDGRPETGKIYGRNGFESNWDTAECLIDGVGDRVANSENKNYATEYNMNITTEECIMGFRIYTPAVRDIPRTATN